MKPKTTRRLRVSRTKAFFYAFGATILFGLGGCSTDFVYSRSYGGYGYNTRHHDHRHHNYGNHGRNSYRQYDHGPRSYRYGGGQRYGDQCETDRRYR